MKVSHLSIALLVVSSSLLSQESMSLDSYISQTKRDIFSYDYKKNEEDSLMQEDSWINPINLNYNYSKSNPYKEMQLSESAAIKIDQPIFRGGGIFYSIKHAEASKRYADYSIDVAKRKMIKDAISLLMQIRQIDLKIEKQKLQIENAKINLELKKEQYLSGQLDSGFLDNAIIERNVAIQALYDVETSKETLISNFKIISDLDYENAFVPRLELVNQDEFLEKNLAIEMAKSAAKRDEENRGIIRAKYLPMISLTGGYNWTKTDSPFKFGSAEKDYYDYGFKVNIPLHINTFRDIESAKIQQLKSEITVLDKHKEMNSLFEKVMQSLDNLEKKQALSGENIEIYSKLLDDTKKLFSVGYKTEYDVELLENSLHMSELDSKVYDLDKQVELLNLYEMYVDE